MAIQIGNQGAATIGSMNPDNTASLTVKMGSGNKADKLIERHEANWPDALKTALSLPIDPLRTETLDAEEVHDALLAVEGRAKFFKDDYKLAGMAVRGRTRGERIVSVVYELPSGRIGQGVIPYDGLEQAATNYERLRERVEAGDIILDADGYVADERRSRATQDAPKAEEVTAAEDRAKAAETKQRETDAKLAEMADKLAALENPQPFEGYEDLKAPQIVEKLKDGGVFEYGIAGLERVLTYEEARKGGSRKTISDAVVEIIEDHKTAEANGTLGSGGADQA